VPGPLLAQPAFYEPSEHYYKAIGRGVSVRWEVPVSKVEEGRDLPATLVITGATNPAEVERPELKKLSPFDGFIVTDLPARRPADGSVRFDYKLRPRNRSVDHIPALEFYYFNPAAAPGKQFPYTLAYSVPIEVTERPEPGAVPMAEPDRLFQLSTNLELRRGPFEPPGWAWGAFALLGPIAAAGWFLVWRWLYPDAQRLAHMRRSRAARRATDLIRRAARTADPPAAIAGALLGYLRTRFPVPDSAGTPPEIASSLVESQVPVELAEAVADVFRGCDRARFAPPGDSGQSLAGEAEAIVSRLEELA
jgi:hypothetical protein